MGEDSHGQNNIIGSYGCSINMANQPTINLVVAQRPIAELVPYAHNSRTHSAEQIKQIADSMEEFGWTNPIIADANGIVAGHGRVLAAASLYAAGKSIKLPNGAKIPSGMGLVIDCTGWSEAQRRAYIIADNQLALNAGWDKDILKQELHALHDLEFDLSLTGFNGEELAGLMFPDLPSENEGGEKSENGYLIQYNLVFDDEQQRDRWYAFIRKLKSDYPNEETIGARLDCYLRDNADVEV